MRIRIAIHGEDTVWAEVDATPSQVRLLDAIEAQVEKNRRFECSPSFHVEVPVKKSTKCMMCKVCSTETQWQRKN